MSVESEPAARPGTQFGKYQLLASIGQGGMADVFLAVAQGPAGFNKLLVIKRLRLARPSDEPEYIGMFLDEARLAARLNHPNVVQTNEVGEHEGAYFIAMEYLEGQAFNRIISRAKSIPSTLPILLRILADALAGIHYAHELADFDGSPLNVVHRDISPHNILVTYDGQTKVVDFGIAKATTRSSQTTVGVLKGKVTYMSPEQARCHNVDRRADIFVLGIVLWEITAGRKMWKGSPEMRVVNSLFTGEIPKLEQARPDAPAELVRICARALAVDPDQRYATAAEMRSDLLAYLENTGQRAGTEEVAHLTQSLFADKRSEFKKVIEHQLRGLKSSGQVALLELSSAGPSSSRSSQSSTRSQVLPNLSPPPTTTDSGFSRRVPPRPRRLLLPSLAAMGVIVVLGLATLKVIQRAPEQATPSEPAAAAPENVRSAPAEPSSAASQEPPPPVVAATTVELTVRASPESAKIYLDDALLPSNPFSGKFPLDGARHRVRVEAKGFEDHNELALFDQDVSLEFDLSQKSSGSRVKRKAAPTAPVEAPPAKTEEPAAPLASGRPAKPKRALSGADPWGPNGAAPEATGKPKRALSGSDPWSQ